jgi:hypothetical protein
MNKTIHFSDVKIITLPGRRWDQAEDTYSQPYSMVLHGTYNKPGNCIMMLSDQTYDLGDIIHLKAVEGAGGEPTLIYFSKSDSIKTFKYRLEWKPPYTTQNIVGIWSIVSDTNALDLNHFIEESLILSKEVKDG